MGHADADPLRLPLMPPPPPSVAVLSRSPAFGGSRHAPTGKWSLALFTDEDAEAARRAVELLATGDG